MKYLGFWVTWNGICPAKQIRSPGKYDATKEY